MTVTRRHITPRSKAAALKDPKGWMIRAAERVCKAAGAPRVTPHGLRGSGATVDVVDEVVPRVEQLGHYLDGDERPGARSPRNTKPVTYGASECGRGDSNSHSITTTRT